MSAGPGAHELDGLGCGSCQRRCVRTLAQPLMMSRISHTYLFGTDAGEYRCDLR